MAKSGTVRIIGGKWKRRQIAFPALPDLRPSPDAVRETLFNWLGQTLHNKTCLDLFAGSGALGFEAASRGARRVDMVDNNKQVIAAITKAKQLIGDTETLHVHRMDYGDYLRRCKSRYDIVFLDPPFRQSLLESTCAALIEHDCLSTHGLVYIESPKSNLPLPIPSTWHIIRESTRGMVKSALIQTNPDQK